MSDLIKQTMGAGEVIRWRRAAGLLLVNEASAPITVQLMSKGSEIFAADGVGRGIKVRPGEGFDEAVLHNKTAGDVEIEVFITGAEVDVQIATGITVTVDNTVANPIPVVHTGTVELTASNVGIVQQPVTVAGDSYTVTAAGVDVSTAANADRRAIHFRNTSDEVDCYLAAFAAGAKADCPVLLRAGDCLLIDDRSAAAAWVAFSDGVDIEVKVQEVTE